MRAVAWGFFDPNLVVAAVSLVEINLSRASGTIKRHEEADTQTRRVGQTPRGACRNRAVA